jgi:hypothetical protein
MACLRHYSGGPVPECLCCGEKRAEFLQIDHIFGGGRKHRAGFSRWFESLAKRGFPEEPMLTVLCANCNHAKETCGVCPHSANEIHDAQIAKELEDCDPW